MSKLLSQSALDSLRTKAQSVHVLLNSYLNVLPHLSHWYDTD